MSRCALHLQVQYAFASIQSRCQVLHYYHATLCVRITLIAYAEIHVTHAGTLLCCQSNGKTSTLTYMYKQNTKLRLK